MAQNQTFLKLKKLENIMKACFFKKKRFHLFKDFPYKNGEAEDMLVVAGRLVMFALNTIRQFYDTPL